MAIVVMVILAVLGFAEFYVWYSEVLWHKSEKDSYMGRR
jgi:hypothetical protein